MPVKLDLNEVSATMARDALLDSRITIHSVRSRCSNKVLRNRLKSLLTQIDNIIDGIFLTDNILGWTHEEDKRQTDMFGS